MNKIVEKVKKLSFDVLRKEKDIAAAYIFGSLVEGFYNDNSDVDIALLFKNPVSLDRELEIAVRLEDRLNREIDLVNLERTSINLSFRIIAKGLLIYEGDYLRHTKFIQEILSRYHDFRLDYERFIKELMEVL